MNELRDKSLEPAGWDADDEEHVLAEDELPPSPSADESLNAEVRLTEEHVIATLYDARSELREVFEGLSRREQVEIAKSIWKIGTHAYRNVRAEAREARLRGVVDEMREHLKLDFTHQRESQQQRIQETLQRYFDRDTGLLDQRLNDVLGDHGELKRVLTEQLAPEGSVLADTLGRILGPESELMRLFGGEAGGEVIQGLEEQVRQVLTESQEAFTREMDPSVEQSAMHRFLGRLKEDLKSADDDIDLKLKKLTESLDANDEGSLISRLMREVESQKTSLLHAVNPDAPGSAMASVQATLKKLIEEQGAAQRKLLEDQDRERKEFELRITEAVTRLDTKHQSAKNSTEGGNQFEVDVLDRVSTFLGIGPYVLTLTGANPGAIPRCKKGDAVVRYTEESAFADAAVVFEAKHDASYTVPKALAELDEARKNRDAQVGIFVMATSHAGPSFPPFARYGSNVLVTWDPDDGSTDTRLEAAVFLGMGLVSRQRRQGSEGDIQALTDLESRITFEIGRLDTIRKSSDGIRKHADNINEEVRKGQDKLGLLVRKAKSVLTALNVELSEESEERQSPIRFGDD